MNTTRYRRLLLGLLMFIGISGKVLCQALSVTDSTKAAIPDMEYLLADDRDTGFMIALKHFNKGNFTRAAKRTLNFGIPSGGIWLHFRLKGETGGIYVIEVDNSRINHLQLIEWNKGQAFFHAMTGDFLPFKKRELFQKQFCFKTSIAAGDSVDYFVFINQAGSTARFPILVSSRLAFDKVSQNTYFFDGIVYGILLFVSLFSAFLFANTRHLFYLYYCLYVATGVLWFFAYFGLGFQFIWSNHTAFQMFAAPLFACLNLMLNLEISSALLVTKKSKSRFSTISNCFKIGMACLALFPMVIDLRDAGIPVNYGYLVVFLSTIIALMLFLISSIIYFIAKRSLVAKIYLVASLIKAVGIINLAMIELNIGMDMLPVETILQIGIIIEIALLSYVIAKRYTEYRNKTTQFIITAQEQERAHMAKEIHDNILSGLTGLKNISEALRYYIEKKEWTESGKGINSVQNALASLYHQSREISHYMMPDYVMKHKINLIAETYISHINTAAASGASPLQIRFSSNGAIRNFSQTATLNIFRIVQELVTNIITHSQAANAGIHFDFRSNGLLLTATDDGKGFNGKYDFGVGILSIKSRVKLLQGHFRIHHRNEKPDTFAKESRGPGVVVTIFIPYHLENYFTKNDY